jgi:hypothetical protein
VKKSAKMSTNEGLCWKMLRIVSFLDVSRETNIKNPSTPSHFLKKIGRSILFAIKMGWYILVTIMVIRQVAHLLFLLATNNLDFLGVLALLRFRIKNVSFLIILFVLLYRRRFLHEINQRRQYLAVQLSTYCNQHGVEQIRRKIQKFDWIFGLSSMILSVVSYLVTNLEFSSGIGNASTSFWPFTSQMKGWSIILISSITVGGLRLVAQLIITWWCLQVYAGICYINAIRKNQATVFSLRYPTDRDMVAFQTSMQAVQAFHSVIERAFGSVLLIHISACLLTSLSFIGELIAGAYVSLDSVLVSVAQIGDNTIVLLGVPTTLCVLFQEEVRFLRRFF